jgi:hypothetical protein
MDQNDLKQIGNLVREEIQKNNEVIKEEIQKNGFKLEDSFIKKFDDLEQKMFEWKSEIINTVDDLAVEIRDEREFREIASHQIAELQKKVGGEV